MLVDPSFHASDHLVKRDLESVSDLPQAVRGGTQNAPLDTADVGSIETALRRQLLLGDARLAAAIGYGRADRPLRQAGGPNLTSAPWHAEISCGYLETHSPTAYTPHFEIFPRLASAHHQGRPISF